MNSLCQDRRPSDPRFQAGDFLMRRKKAGCPRFISDSPCKMQPLLSALYPDHGSIQPSHHTQCNTHKWNSRYYPAYSRPLPLFPSIYTFVHLIAIIRRSLGLNRFPEMVAKNNEHTKYTLLTNYEVFKIYLNIALPSRSEDSKWFTPSYFWNKIVAYFFIVYIRVYAVINRPVGTSLSSSCLENLTLA